jgi:hypothetical protein
MQPSAPKAHAQHQQLPAAAMDLPKPVPTLNGNSQQQQQLQQQQQQNSAALASAFHQMAGHQQQTAAAAAAAAAAAGFPFHSAGGGPFMPFGFMSPFMKP